ncbi:beta-amyrin 28-monooxygenase-like [Punica granatum]|uniref:Uncharacterized protein n=2 Tax=Punica granatum TaxID=22663 RepID=A0A218W1S1_PUNGR|nr:beta-amyrin 28-monooxygenase-like [Punica granatum]OWM66072.1 hypothetical protein CDL15_Pgr015499 [Punica granatum]PKI76237.1 hypothetical protein CRG98_003348 [Punica granatum]
MDLFCICGLYLAILYVSLSLVYLVRKHKSRDGTDINLPPGRMGWPVIGETLDFLMAASRGTPWKFIRDRTLWYSTDVFRTSLLGENIAVFCGASGNKFLFSSENKYVTSWWPSSMKKITHFPENAENSSKERSSSSTKTRSIILDFLKPEALQHCIPIMDSMAREHLEADWAPYDKVRAFPLLKKYTFALASRLFMNIQDPEQASRLADPFALVSAGLVSVPINFPGTAFNKAIQGGKSIRGELLSIVKKRRKEVMEGKDTAARDLLSRMLLSEDENGKPVMKETEIVNVIIGKLIAGHDSTSTAITFVVKYLAEYPDIYEKVLKEQMEIARRKGPDELLNWEDIKKMRYSWMVACEAMRLCPSGQGAFRQAITDFTYNGFTIPKGWKTYWTVHSTHKDPRYFPNPEKFDPSRFDGSGPAPFTFVPFGGGPRMCPGKEFARVQILVFMHNVVTKFRLKKVIPDEKIIYSPNPVPASGLPIRIEPSI